MHRLRERWRALGALRDYPELEEDARDGDRAQVTGIVRAIDELLIAPLSGRRCVAYASRVRGQRHPVFKGSGTRGETRQIRPFTIDRGALGTIEIVGSAALLAVEPLALRHNATREGGFLAFHGLGQGRATFSELVVAVGMRVTVGGTIVVEERVAPPDRELGFRDTAPPQRALAGSTERPLLIAQR